MPVTSAQGEVNTGVQTATAQSGMESPLDEVTVTGGIGSGSTNPGSGIDWSMFSDPTLQSVGTGAVGSAVDSAASDAAGSLSGGNWLNTLLSSFGVNSSNAGTLAAEAGVAGIGLAQAKGAQSDAAAQANSLKQPAQNLINAGNDQLAQFKNQQLTPQQQAYVDFASQEGQALIDSGAGLKAIATQAFGDYQSGTLPQADQLKLDQQTAAQKQQIASQLGQSGMADSSVLSAYNQQIENQALITKQNLLDARFATGVTAYNTWLNSTAAGIAVKNQGAQFAQTAFQDMMQNGLALESQGMAGLTQAIALTVQSDDQLSKSVSDLMGNLAAAYAYTVSGGGKGGTGTSGAAASGGGGILSAISSQASKAGTSLVKSGASSLFGDGLGAAGSGALADSSGVFGDIASGAAAQEGSVAADVASDLGFSSAGGAAAGAGAAAAGTGAVGSAGAAALGASGSFATGGAAGGGAAAAGGAASSLGAAGLAIPLAAAAIPFMIGMNGSKINDQGNAAMSGWMKATGITYKANAGSAYNNGNTFQTTNAQNSAASNPGIFVAPSGQTMTPKQAAAAISAWGKANGVNTGNITG